MHALGKFFLFLVIIGSIGALYMTSRAFEVRNAWMKVAEAEEKNVETNRQAVERSQRERLQLTLNYESEVRPWGNSWTGIRVGLQPGAEGAGGLLVQLGMPLLKQPEDPGRQLLLHAFQTAPGNSEPVYVGEFRVEQLGEGQSVLMPNWVLRPNELQQWVPGDNWHFREKIPGGDQVFIGALNSQLVEGLQRLVARQAELARTEAVIEETKKVLERRIGEIEGTPDSAEKQEKLPPEFVVGYQQTIEAQESAVNDVTAEVQRLRDQLYEVQRRIEELKLEIDSELRILEGSGTQAQANLAPAR